MTADTGGLRPGQIVSLFSSLGQIAKKMARGDFNMADELLSAAWIRVLECQHKPYCEAQFHIVGVNGMKRELRKILRHKTGLSHTGSGRRRVEMPDDIESLDRSVDYRLDVADLVELSDDKQKQLYTQFLNDPDSSLTSAGKAIGVSPATVSRMTAKTRSRLPVLDPHV